MSSRLHSSNPAPRDEDDESDELLREYPSQAGNPNQVLCALDNFLLELKEEKDNYEMVFNITSESQTLNDEQYRKLTEAFRRLLKHYTDLFCIRALPVVQQSPQKFPIEDNSFHKMYKVILKTLELLQKNGSGAVEHLSLSVQTARETMDVLKETAPQLSSDWSHLDELLESYRPGATDEVQSSL